MTHKTKITVYIVSHNYGKYLSDAIESVLCQTSDNWELLIIDDNSSDNTAEVMNLYKGDERIKLFHTSGIGLPAICNLALKEAKGEYLIRLDGDDIFDENALLVLGNYLDKHKDVAIVFPDYYLLDEFGEVYAETRRHKISHKNHVFDIPANGACTLMRKDVLEKIGGYREDLGVQDGYDIWTKIAVTYKCINVNLPLFYYRRHDANLTNNPHHILAAQRRIKMDSVIDQLNEYRPIIAVIPCRRNFDFSIDLWKQEIDGKSLLQRNLEKCLKSRILDHIIVTSDSPEVKDVMELFDDPRLAYVERRREDTIRSKKLVSTIEKIAERLDPNFKGITTISYIQTPFVATETLEEAISTLVMNRSDCSFGVEEIRDPLFRRMPHGLMAINPSKGLSTDFDVIYRESNTSLATKTVNFKTGSLTGPKIVNFLVSKDESFFINSYMNLEIAKKMCEYKDVKV
jgi:glycosyltransferase involved in cell wall biosynthesis